MSLRSSCRGADSASGAPQLLQKRAPAALASPQLPQWTSTAVISAQVLRTHRKGSNWDGGAAAAVAERRRQGAPRRHVALFGDVRPRALQREGDVGARSHVALAALIVPVVWQLRGRPLPAPDRHPRRAAVRDRHRRQRAPHFLNWLILVSAFALALQRTGARRRGNAARRNARGGCFQTRRRSRKRASLVSGKEMQKNTASSAV